MIQNKKSCKQKEKLAQKAEETENQDELQIKFKLCEEVFTSRNNLK